MADDVVQLVDKLNQNDKGSPLSIQLIEMVESSQKVFDKKEFTYDRTGHAIWPMSAGLCEYFVTHPEFLRDKTVLELGAGTGVCGIVLSKVNPSLVVLTDRDEDVMVLAQHNMKINNCPANYETLVLKWGEHLDEFQAKFPDLFDVIVGCEIIAYNRADVLPLFETVIKLLKPNGKFIFAFNNRKQKTYDVLQQHMPEFFEFEETEYPGKKWNPYAEPHLFICTKKRTHTSSSST